MGGWVEFVSLGIGEEETVEPFSWLFGRGGRVGGWVDGRRDTYRIGKKDKKGWVGRWVGGWVGGLTG